MKKDNWSESFDGYEVSEGFVDTSETHVMGEISVKQDDSYPE